MKSLVADLPAGSSGPLSDAVLEACGPIYHTLLFVRIGLGWTVERCADAMGLSPDTVRVMQHRALTRLREELLVSS